LSQSAVAGGDIVLSVAASGHPLPLSYRWRKNGAAITNMILHSTNCFFTITDVQPNPGTNTVTYTVVVTNLAGTASLSSNAVLTVLADTDGDGLPDDWESAWGFSATNATDAILDSDGDGATNAQEYLAGTDPHDAQDHLRLELLRDTNPDLLSVRFLALSNRTYTLQACSAFSAGNAWHSAADALAAPTNRIIEILQPGDPASHQFFRLLTPRSP
jgi:hypothetical protein